MNAKGTQLSQIRGLILDMDGVLWRDDQPIGDLHACFDKIAQQKLVTVLATNNSTKSVGQYLEKLSGFGVDLKDNKIITSALATATYLKHLYPKGGPIHVIGEIGLVEALGQAGFYQIETGDEEVLAVVAGLDRKLTYMKLEKAALYIQNGALFIGTNSDHTLPTPKGEIPGAGSILAALETATHQKPVVIGKPQPEMYRWAMEWMGTSPENTLVVGDRLETDISGAQEIGCKTALVLSGVATQAQAMNWKPLPDIIAADLREVLASL